VLSGDLLTDAPSDQVSLGRLTDSLGERSFGILMLLLALLGLLPGVSAVVGVLLAFPAFQMMIGRSGPVFPKRVASWRFATQQLERILRRTVPALQYLEKFVQPRWSTPFDATKRVVGAVVLLLAGLLLAPVPLSNIPPALVIMLISVAYLEEDGALLCVAMIAAVLLLTVAAAAVWGAMNAAAR
jgi:hypothetical protein